MIPLVSFIALAASAPASEGLALEAIRNFSACAVNRFPNQAAALLEMDPNSDAYGPKMREFVRANGRCVLPNHKLGSSTLPFAGAIAEALIADRYANVPLAQAASVPKAPINEVTMIGQCVSQKNPDAVMTVLKATPGSKQELEALNMTGPYLSGCVKSGLTMTLNRVSARAIYALGAYRTYAGPPAPAAPSEPAAK